MIYLYLLELQHGKAYVGITNDLTERYQKHVEGRGAIWTKCHPPVRMVMNQAVGNDRGRALEAEKQLTLAVAAKGWDVRGGPWCGVFDFPPREWKMSDEQRERVKQAWFTKWRADQDAVSIREVWSRMGL
jgi:predicted GIY-YIG superfamily endonuclease